MTRRSVLRLALRVGYRVRRLLLRSWFQSTLGIRGEAWVTIGDAGRLQLGISRPPMEKDGLSTGLLRMTRPGQCARSNDT